MEIKYSFTATPWQYAGPESWTFVSLPVSMASEIRNLLKSEEEGWGRLKATVKIGNTTWKTAIWYDTKMKTYLLPFKAEVRKRESIQTGKKITVSLAL